MKKFKFILTITIFVIISGCTSYPYLGDGYRFDQTGKYTLSIIDSDNNVVIEGCVLKYVFDSNYILAAQRPWSSIPGDHINMTYTQMNRAFEKSTFLQYWIIYKKKKDIPYGNTNTYTNVYGPYNWKAYLAKKKELGVPDSLKLSHGYKY